MIEEKDRVISSDLVVMYWTCCCKVWSFILYFLGLTLAFYAVASKILSGMANGVDPNQNALEGEV